MKNNSLLSKIIINNLINDPPPFDLATFITNVCSLLTIEIDHIELTLLSSEDIHKMNLDHFNVDSDTDTISFNLSPTTIVTGDIYICPDVIKRNAIEFNESYEKEYKIVIIHSVLHLIGYTDDNQNSLNEMTTKQNQVYDQLHEKD